MRDTGTISSVTKALRILQLLEEHEGLRVTEVAAELGTSKSTAHRYLKTLHDEEYVVRDGDVFRVGLRFFSHGILAKSRYEGLDLIRDRIDQLAAESGEWVHFAVPEHGKVVCLAESLGDRGVKVALDIGDRAPLHTVSSGKAILAEWDDEEIEQYIAQNDLGGGADNTVADTETLWHQLKQTRERGYSQSHQEYEGELIGIGTVVRDPDESVIGAIAISGPPHRIQGPRLDEELPELLQGTSREITLNLRYMD